MSRAGRRAVVVLGYSEGGEDRLHPVCAARLVRAAALATEQDVVVLSGWARTAGGRSEAALMAAAWDGSAAELVVDEVARTTVENAVNAVRDALAAGAGEILVVTSSWHAPRARAAFRWLLRGTGVRVRTASPPGRSLRASAREIGLWPLLAAQLAAAPSPSLTGRPSTRGVDRPIDGG